MPEPPTARQGTPLTVQVTSSTNWLFSVMVSVLEIVPPISVPRALPAHATRAATNAAHDAIHFTRSISSLLPGVSRSGSNVRLVYAENLVLHRPLEQELGPKGGPNLRNQRGDRIGCRQEREAQALKRQYATDLPTPPSVSEQTETPRYCPPPPALPGISVFKVSETDKQPQTDLAEGGPQFTMAYFTRATDNGS